MTRQFNAIKNAVNFGKGKRMSIQVNDKVQWVAPVGDTEVIAKGVVESIGEFNGVKTFTVRLFADQTQTMVSASRVTKI